MENGSSHRVVIVGAGFGGLRAAKRLGRAPAQVTVIDRRNFHLFQPLLYQVATGGLPATDIAAPIRAILKRRENTTILQSEVTDMDPVRKVVLCGDGEVFYDSLIVATGSRHHYFGRDEWEAHAPGLKTVEDAHEMRRRILNAFEEAEKETDAKQRQTWLTFVIVGGGPTGVELAGAVAELAHHTLKSDFRRFDSEKTRIVLLEAGSRVLSAFVPGLSAKATASLRKLGVEVHVNAKVLDVLPHAVVAQMADASQTIQTRTILWAAGNRASPLGKVLEERLDASLDITGRILVEPDFSVPGHPDVFVIGDLAHYAHWKGQPMPGLAAVAMQEGDYVARVITARLNRDKVKPFRYRDRGLLAVIGRHAAVAQIGGLRFGGYPAWLVWILVHIRYLVDFEERVRVFLMWSWGYFTKRQGARIIFEDWKRK